MPGGRNRRLGRRCWNCDRTANAATGICRPPRSTPGSARSNARFATTAPRASLTAAAPIAAANWCAGRSGHPTDCCVTRPRRAGYLSRKDALGHDPAGVAARARPALHCDGCPARCQRARGRRRRCDSSRSRSAERPGARARPRSRPTGAEIGADRLHRRAGHRTFAEGDRRALPGAVRSLGRPCRSRRDDRLLGSLSARLSRCLRTGRSGGRRHPGVSGLPQHPGGSRYRAGADRGGRERSLSADPRTARRCGKTGRARCRAPPIRRER